jgi:uncharacterized protein (DUF736 family)
MARSRSSSPATKWRLPRDTTRSLNSPSSADAPGQGCGPVVAALTDRHQGRDSHGLGKQQQEITMAQIGTFTRAEDGSYTGTIKTLSLNIKARFIPAESSQNEKAPALRVMAGNVEIGAAWQRTSKENTVYHSVKLDDPSFPAPIFANLVSVDDGYALVWSR